MKSWITLFRVNDYGKNVLVFLPAFFGGQILANHNLSRLSVLFMLYCFLCSGVYIINDLFDRRWDANHPTKKHKPVTSGTIKTLNAGFAAGLLILLALVPAYVLGVQIFIPFSVYLLINLFYSAFGKHVPFLDLVLITYGFLLRLQTGGILTGVPISAWLYLIIILLAFGFGFVKRLEEIRLLTEHQIDMHHVRPSLKFYTESFARPVIVGIVWSAGLAYLVYTLSRQTIDRLNSPFVFVTCLPVAAGIYQYLKLVKQGNQSLMPQSVIMHNGKIQLSLICWLLMMAWFIYR